MAVKLLGRELLDRQLVDDEDVLCGKVDDVELERVGEHGLKVAAVLAGPGAWPDRLPRVLRGAARRLLGRRAVRIPWSEVCEANSAVRLRLKAAQLRSVPLTGRPRLSTLLGTALESRPGVHGRVHDVEVEDRGGELHVVAVLVGGRGLLERLGLPARGRPAERVGWKQVAERVG